MRDEESARARERWGGRERDREKMREIDGTMRDDGRWKMEEGEKEMVKGGRGMVRKPYEITVETEMIVRNDNTSICISIIHIFYNICTTLNLKTILQRISLKID